MRFTVRWPEGDEMQCYSPSRVVREFLEAGRSYPIADFMARSRRFLAIASERVRAKYGYACSAALDQLAALEARAASSDPRAAVAVTSVELATAAPRSDSDG
jgi:uncharacterized repeat protein (TIGR04042 family)